MQLLVCGDGKSFGSKSITIDSIEAKGLGGKYFSAFGTAPINYSSPRFGSHS